MAGIVDVVDAIDRSPSAAVLDGNGSGGGGGGDDGCARPRLVGGSNVVCEGGFKAMACADVRETLKAEDAVGVASTCMAVTFDSCGAEGPGILAESGA